MFYNYYTLHDHLLNRFRNRMLELFEESESRDFSSWPPTNIFEQEGELLMETIVPGVKEEDLDLNVHQNTITISGKRSVEFPDKAYVHRQERPASKFTRSFKLPYRVNTDEIDAQLKNGVLTISLPKHPEEQPKKINIKAS